VISSPHLEVEPWFAESPLTHGQVRSEVRTCPKSWVPQTLMLPAPYTSFVPRTSNRTHGRKKRIKNLPTLTPPDRPTKEVPHPSTGPRPLRLPPPSRKKKLNQPHLAREPFNGPPMREKHSPYSPLPRASQSITTLTCLKIQAINPANHHTTHTAGHRLSTKTYPLLPTTCG